MRVSQGQIQGVLSAALKPYLAIAVPDSLSNPPSHRDLNRDLSYKKKQGEALGDPEPSEPHALSSTICTH